MDSVSPSLSAPPRLVFSHSLSLKNKQITLKIKKKKVNSVGPWGSIIFALLELLGLFEDKPRKQIISIQWDRCHNKGIIKTQSLLKGQRAEVRLRGHGVQEASRIPKQSCTRDTRQQEEVRSCSPGWGSPSENEHLIPCPPGICCPLPDGTPVPTRVPSLLTQGKKQRPSQWPGARWRGWEVTRPGWSMQLASSTASWSPGPGQAHSAAAEAQLPP